MLRLALLVGLAMPTFALAADYNASGNGSRHGCQIDQSGNRYCIVSPIEKQYTNCEPGVACYHMQSGQHYTVQRPIILGDNQE